MIITDLLDEYFPNPKPFLDFKDPFQLLIATLLSSNTTDKQANRAAKRLFAKGEISSLSPAEIEEAIRPAGLHHKKAKNILEISRIISQKYKGKVPSNLKKLEKLPGVGHKTASVVMLFGFNKPAFPVDTHIKRLAKRWGLSQKNDPEEDLKRLFPKKDWGKIHLQMIYFGKKFCKARGHTNCPICSLLVHRKESLDFS